MRARSLGGLDVRVTLDVSAVPPRITGAGRYVAEIARRLPDSGVSTTLVTRRDDGARWRELSPSSAVASPVAQSRLGRLAYERWMLGRSRWARDAEVWHGPHYTVPHNASVPRVVTIHDLTFFTNPEWHERAKVIYFRRAIAYSIRHAKVAVCVSEYSARQLTEVTGAALPIVVAPLGVDLSRFSRDEDGDEERFATANLSRTTPYVLFVGTAEPRKGLDVLLRAFTEVAHADPLVELWIGGLVGWGVSDLETQLRAHPFASRVRRLGFVDDAALPALYRRASVVAYPSRAEGFGLPVLEALACGAAVVTSASTVMAEVAGDAASLVAAGDSDGLANAVLSALVAPTAARERNARRARERAEVFTWDACVAAHVRAYDLARGA